MPEKLEFSDFKDFNTKLKNIKSDFEIFLDAFYSCEKFDQSLLKYSSFFFVFKIRESINKFWNENFDKLKAFEIEKICKLLLSYKKFYKNK